MEVFILQMATGILGFVIIGSGIIIGFTPLGEWWGGR